MVLGLEKKVRNSPNKDLNHLLALHSRGLGDGHARMEEILQDCTRYTKNIIWISFSSPFPRFSLPLNIVCQLYRTKKEEEAIHQLVFPPFKTKGTVAKSNGIYVHYCRQKRTKLNAWNLLTGGNFRANKDREIATLSTNWNTVAPGKAQPSIVRSPAPVKSRLLQNCAVFIPLPCRDFTGAGDRTIEDRTAEKAPGFGHLPAWNKPG